MLERRLERKGLRPRVAASVIAVLWLAAIVVFGILEHLLDPDSFDNVWDGMWWATQTVTTVGYGDVVPDDTVGKVIASVLMIAGLSLFAVVTAIVASAFVARAQAEQVAGREDLLMEKLDGLSAELATLRAQLGGPAGDEPSGASPPG
jgi:voltage-gated potassium channel Kch